MPQDRDEQEILALLCEYCDSVDRGDIDGFAELFAEGAWGIAGDLAEGAAGVRAVLDNVIIYDGTPNTRHLMSNVRIDVGEGGETATARCCITVMQQRAVALSPPSSTSIRTLLIRWRVFGTPS